MSCPRCAEVSGLCEECESYLYGRGEPKSILCKNCGLPIERYVPSGGTPLYWHHPVGGAYYRTCWRANRGGSFYVYNLKLMAEPKETK